MSYLIEIYYSTGNTFGTHDEVRIIEDVEFSDLESAKEALKTIQIHKEMNKELSSCYKKEEHESLISNIASQPWAVKSEFGLDYEYEFSVKTSSDSDDRVKVYAFWMGYFETLHEARIISKDHDELSIKF